jgi:hypothetical protein
MCAPAATLSPTASASTYGGGASSSGSEGSTAANAAPPSASNAASSSTNVASSFANTAPFFTNAASPCLDAALSSSAHSASSSVRCAAVGTWTQIAEPAPHREGATGETWLQSLRSDSGMCAAGSGGGSEDDRVKRARLAELSCRALTRPSVTELATRLVRRVPSPPAVFRAMLSPPAISPAVPAPPAVSPTAPAPPASIVAARDLPRAPHGPSTVSGHGSEAPPRLVCAAPTRAGSDAPPCRDSDPPGPAGKFGLSEAGRIPHSCWPLPPSTTLPVLPRTTGASTLAAARTVGWAALAAIVSRSPVGAARERTRRVGAAVIPAQPMTSAWLAQAWRATACLPRRAVESWSCE